MSTPIVISVAVMQLTVFGLDSYRAKCMHCAWTGTPRAKEATATRDAQKHGAAHIPKEQR